MPRLLPPLLPFIRTYRRGSRTSIFGFPLSGGSADPDSFSRSGPFPVAEWDSRSIGWFLLHPHNFSSSPRRSLPSFSRFLFQPPGRSLTPSFGSFGPDERDPSLLVFDARFLPDFLSGATSFIGAGGNWDQRRAESAMGPLWIQLRAKYPTGEHSFENPDRVPLARR